MPTPCPSECPILFAKPALASSLSASSCILAPVTPGLMFCGNPLVCPAHGLVDAHLLVACAADAHRARRVRAIAAYACAKVEDDEITSLELAVRGTACGLAPLGPAFATMFAKASSLAPRRFMANSELDTSRSLMPGCMFASVFKNAREQLPALAS